MRLDRGTLALITFLWLLQLAVGKSQTVPPGVGSRQANARKALNKVSKMKASPSAAPKTLIVGAESAACKDVDQPNVLQEYGAAKHADVAQACISYATETSAADQAKNDIDKAILLKDNPQFDESTLCRNLKQPDFELFYGSGKVVKIGEECLKFAGADLTQGEAKKAIDAAVQGPEEPAPDETAVCPEIDASGALNPLGSAKQASIRSACLVYASKAFTAAQAMASLDEALNEPDRPPLKCENLKDHPGSLGVPKAVALRSICVAKDSYTNDQFSQGLAEVEEIDDQSGYPDAIEKLGLKQPNATSDPLGALAWSAVNATPQVKRPDCYAYFDGKTKQLEYSFNHFLPATGADSACGDGGVLGFFNIAKTSSLGNTTFGNSLQYLYNPNLGTNQYSSDLVTSTFSQGFQIVLAGTATTGTPQASTPSSGSSSTSVVLSPQAATPSDTSTADPVATAVQKMEAGGDFNLRFSYPVLGTGMGSTSWSTYFLPSLGFNLSSTSSQSNSAAGSQTGITAPNEYLIYIPIESYFSTSSIAGDSSDNTVSASLFVDARAGSEIVSSGFAKSIGVSDRAFFLAQAAAGVDFGSFRVGLQYFLGPSQAYTLANSAGQTTSVNTSVKGFHVVFSFSPPKK